MRRGGSRRSSSTFLLESEDDDELVVGDEPVHEPVVDVRTRRDELIASLHPDDTAPTILRRIQKALSRRSSVCRPRSCSQFAIVFLLSPHCFFPAAFALVDKRLVHQLEVA